MTSFPVDVGQRHVIILCLKQVDFESGQTLHRMDILLASRFGAAVRRIALSGMKLLIVIAETLKSDIGLNHVGFLVRVPTYLILECLLPHLLRKTKDSCTLREITCLEANVFYPSFRLGHCSGDPFEFNFNGNSSWEHSTSCM